MEDPKQGPIQHSREDHVRRQLWEMYSSLVSEYSVTFLVREGPIGPPLILTYGLVMPYRHEDAIITAPDVYIREASSRLRQVLKRAGYHSVEDVQITPEEKKEQEAALQVFLKKYEAALEEEGLL